MGKNDNLSSEVQALLSKLKSGNNTPATAKTATAKKQFIPKQQDIQQHTAPVRKNKPVKQHKTNAYNKKKQYNEPEINEDIEEDDHSTRNLSIPGFDSIENNTEFQEMKEQETVLWYENPESHLGSFVKTKHSAKYKNAEEALAYIAPLYQRMADNFSEESNRKNAWMSTMLRSGTLSDKIAAYTLMVQENPIMRLPLLDTLLSMSARHGSRESYMVVSGLKELFIKSLLPENRKLIALENRSYNKPINDVELLVWYFEDELKVKYDFFISHMEKNSYDNVFNTRKSSLHCAVDLLRDRPEAEQKLLKVIVNKLGDPERKMAGLTVSALSKVLDSHPGMKTVVVAEVERLMFRPHVTDKARYYCTVFLNRLLFTKDDSELARKLISMYFSLFYAYTDKKVSNDDDEFRKKKKFDLSSNKKNKKEKITKNKKLKNADKEKNDIEEAKIVKTRILSALLTGVNRAFPYARLDDNNTEMDKLYDEQTDQLFRIVHGDNFATSVQALMLLFNVMTERSSVSDRFYSAVYNMLFSPLLHSTNKKTLFFNLLYKTMKNDYSVERSTAFVKRLLQTCFIASPTFICGALILVSEIMAVKPDVAMLMRQTEEDPDEDETEVFKDADSDNDAEEKESSSDSESKTTTENNIDNDDDDKKNDNKNVSNKYDPLKRAPQYSNAQHSCLWELTLLSQHFHPSVVKFTKDIISGERISYPGDPLKDFQTMSFLDRFVYRNPKTKVKEMSAASKLFGHKNDSYHVAPPVNSAEFLLKNEADIPVADRFYYRYFKLKSEKEGQVKVKVKAEEEMDIEAFADAAMEAELDRLADIDDDMDIQFSGDEEESPIDDDESGDEGEWVMMDGEAANKYGREDVADNGTILDDDNDEEANEESDDSDDSEDMTALLGDDDDSDDDDEYMDDMDEETRAKKQRVSVFASAEEVADILRESGKSSSNKFDVARADKFDNTRKRGPLKSKKKGGGSSQNKRHKKN